MANTTTTTGQAGTWDSTNEELESFYDRKAAQRELLWEDQQAAEAAEAAEAGEPTEG